MCANIPHAKQLLCYLAFSFSGLGWRTSYDWQATATKLQVTISIDALCGRLLGPQFLGFVLNYSGHGMCSQATPGQLNVWNP